MWEEVYKDLPKIFGAILLSWIFVGACFGVAAIVAKMDPSLKLSEFESIDESSSEETGGSPQGDQAIMVEDIGQ